MDANYDLIGEKGLEFFGTISASLTHEMKNSLAILTENAGLLEDLALLTEKGTPFDTERLKTLAGRIQKQIQRSDGIIKKMNQFAHSVDEARKRVNLGELMEFVSTLVNRIAFMRGVTLETRPSSAQVSIITSPFILEMLIWRCMDRAMEGVGKGETLVLAVEPAERGAQIRIAGCSGWSASSESSFPTEVEQAMLDALDGEIAADRETGEIVLTLPGDRAS